MADTSRLEQARDEIVAEFDGITTANGYRCNPTVLEVIRPLDKMTDLTTAVQEIGIEIGDYTVEAKDTAWTVFDVVADVHVVGAVTAATSTDNEATSLVDAAEALRHDITRKVAEIHNKYATQLAAWNVTKTKAVSFFGPMLLGEKRNRALVGCTFSIRIWKCSNTFAYEAGGDADGPSGTVILDSGTGFDA